MRKAFPLVLTWTTARIFADPRHARRQAAFKGTFELPDGRRARPVFELLAGKYLDPRYAPAAVAERTGIEASTIIRIAAEIAEAAFEREVIVEQPWTDMKGERHERMIGRPVAFHAMRGISAHSNGFQTARALHLLQILVGSIDCPGGFRFKPPYPRPVAGQPRPHGGACADTALAGPHLGYPRGPEDLLLEADGETAQRIDKAFSWDAPLSAHGMMHMVNLQTPCKRPCYRIDTLFLIHGENMRGTHPG